MAGAATALSLLGTVVQTVGVIASGRAQQRDAEFQAVQHERRAKETKASAFREAEEMRRRTRLILSESQARAGARGLAGDDPTVQEIQAEIAGFGDTEARTMQALGVRAAAQERLAARATRESAPSDFQIMMSAAGTLLGGLSSSPFARKYAGTFSPQPQLTYSTPGYSPSFAAGGPGAGLSANPRYGFR